MIGRFVTPSPIVQPFSLNFLLQVIQSWTENLIQDPFQRGFLGPRCPGCGTSCRWVGRRCNSAPLLFTLSHSKSEYHILKIRQSLNACKSLFQLWLGSHFRAVQKGRLMECYFSMMGNKSESREKCDCYM